MRYQKTCLIGLACCLPFVLNATSHAAGFLIYDASAQGLGKGSAQTASIDEPAAVLFNPAAIVFVPGTQITLGGLWATGNCDFHPRGNDKSISAEQLHFFLPTIFGTFKIRDWLGFGLGVYTTFGLGTEWPEDWIGRENSISAEIQSVTFSATSSYKLWKDYLSLGAGLNLIRAIVDMRFGLPEAIGGWARIGGATWGFGAHVALLGRIFPNTFHVGLTYHSRAQLDFMGKADFEPMQEEFSSILFDQPGRSSITLPDILSFGLMVRPFDQITLTADLNLVLWSTYDKLKVDFAESEDREYPRRFHDTVTVRLGLDWATGWSGLNLRCGFIFDQNPSPKDTLSPSLPDSHRINFSVGAGYKWNWGKVDFGYMLVYFLPSEAIGGEESPEGTYRTLAHLTGT